MAKSRQLRQPHCKGAEHARPAPIHGHLPHKQDGVGGKRGRTPPRAPSMRMRTIVRPMERHGRQVWKFLNHGGCSSSRPNPKAPPPLDRPQNGCTEQWVLWAPEVPEILF